MRQRWIRLLPIMMLTYIIAFMDRTNIAFAIPTMSKELGFAPSVVGFAAGVLFLGYGISQSAGGWLADRGHGKTLIKGSAGSNLALQGDPEFGRGGCSPVRIFLTQGAVQAH